MFSSVFLFFEFTPPEIMLILFVVLLLFGGDKLPGLARGLGKGIRDFKDASEGVKREINNQIDSYEKKKEEPKAAEAATPEVTEHLSDNPEMTKEGGAAAATTVANTVPIGQSHSASDHVTFDGTPEADPELYKHYRGESTTEEAAHHEEEPKHLKD